MDIIMTDIGKITPYIRNPRKNTNAIDKVAGSIKEFGWKQPIVVDKEMIIVVGHTRYMAAQKLEINEVPVLIANDLTPEQVKAYRIADNKTGEFSEWDDELLLLEIEELSNTNFDLLTIGLSDTEINNMLNDELLLPDLLPNLNIEGADETANKFVVVYNNEEEKNIIVERCGFNPDKIVHSILDFQ